MGEKVVFEVLEESRVGAGNRGLLHLVRSVFLILYSHETFNFNEFSWIWRVWKRVPKQMYESNKEISRSEPV